MIISHKYKFIFIKCGKVAGTSLEVALRPYLGEDDVSTPVAEDKLDNGPEWIGPKNYRNNINYNKRVSSGSSRGVFYEHAWAYEVKGQVSHEVWDSYYKFAIERDPRDKSLSVFFHNKNGIKWPLYRNVINFFQALIPFSFDLPFPHPSIAKTCSLSRWLKEDRRHCYAENWDRYTVDDEVIVDKIYSYSSFDEMITDIEELIESKLDLPKLKSNFRPTKELSMKETELLELLMENEIYKKEYTLISPRN